MTPNLTLAILAGLLFGCGVVLLLSRSLVRALLGVLLMGNGVNITFLVASGAPGRAPIIDKYDAAGTVIGPDGISDPLPQAMVLTAIVITLAVTGFVLALSHRQWQLAASDNVEDDAEDARIQELAEANDLSGSDYTDTADPHALADDEEEATPPDPVTLADAGEGIPEEVALDVLHAHDGVETDRDVPRAPGDTDPGPDPAGEKR